MLDAFFIAALLCASVFIVAVKTATPPVPGPSVRGVAIVVSFAGTGVFSLLTVIAGIAQKIAGG